MWSMLDKIICLLSGEWMLNWRPNGGTVIALRSLQVATELFLAALFLLEATDPNRVWFTLEPSRFFVLIHENLGWFGALLAISYTALYARFSSQWAYLADLYNQIHATIIPLGDEFDRPAYVAWVAGFIEDAFNLHLAEKPMFAECILSMLKIKDVPEQLANSHFKYSLAEIEEKLQEALGAE